MHRRRKRAMTKRVQSVVVSGVLLLALALPTWGSDRWSLTILHTNDLHGRLLAFDYGDGEDAPAWPQGYLGGLARRSTAVAELRDEIEHALVLIDTGDVFTRGPWHEKWYGEPEMEAMNLMGYDLLVVGNNELKPIWDDPRSQEMMLSLMRRSRFPWLAANLVIDDDAATGDSPNYVEGIHPFVVRTFGEVRVGFLGLTTPASAEYPHLTEWTVIDETACARRWVPRARQECNILILVSHLGHRTEQALAAAVGGIDAIVGGHSHSMVREPVWVDSPDGRRVPIAQAGELGVVLGRFDLVFERAEGEDKWALVEAQGELIPLDEEVAEDPAMAAFLNPYVEAEPVAVGAGAP
jgi:2',3'-cyclic-nucleotide 2'-phosphodiesterase (5'-nucleotidase family)